MSVILILIIASLSLALFFLAGFIWAVKSGQFEDTYTPSMRILLDGEGRPPVSSPRMDAQETFLDEKDSKPAGSRRSGPPATSALNRQTPNTHE